MAALRRLAALAHGQVVVTLDAINDDFCGALAARGHRHVHCRALGPLGVHLGSLDASLNALNKTDT